jgi:hypothetical protein
VVIGFDTRFLSDRYAAEVARVMAANDIKTWLARADTPTPAISYAVKQQTGHGRRDDHRQPQPAALQRRQAQGRLRRQRQPGAAPPVSSGC